MYFHELRYPFDHRVETRASFSESGSNFVVSLLFPVLNDTIGLSAEYLVFALIGEISHPFLPLNESHLPGVVSIISIFSTVPETKGRSLEEIEEQMLT